MRTKFIQFLLLSTMIGVAACGGGGGGGTTPTNTAPIADAGADFSVDEGVAVEIDASGSMDAEDDALTFAWTQSGGSPITLNNANKARSSFTAPSVAGGTTLTFEVVVGDGTATAKDTVKITVNDTTAPTSGVKPAGKILGKSEPVVVTFNEAMDPASLALDGTLATETDVAWSSENKVLTLSPNADDGEWISGDGKTLSIDAKDAAGNAAARTENEWPVKLVFENFQAADVVIGQTDFETRTGGTAADKFASPAGIAYREPWLFVSEQADRVLGFDGIPTANGASASVVLGLADFDTTSFGTTPVDATHLDAPRGLAFAGDQLLVTDSDHWRIAIYNQPTVGSPGQISVVVGQPDKMSANDNCTADTTSGAPFSVYVHEDRMLVADTANHRVLIWNEIPSEDGVPADLVLGQTEFVEHCAANDTNHDGTANTLPDATTLSSPTGMWSDGERLVIADYNNNRVLVWNTFPTVNGQAANLVLGQADFEHNTQNDENQDDVVDVDGSGAEVTSARTLFRPVGVVGHGGTLIVSDNNNNRILVWNEFPTESFAPADVVLGQSSMSGRASNDTDQDGNSDAAPDARTFTAPQASLIVNDLLLIPDNANRRVLIFRSQ